MRADQQHPLLPVFLRATELGFVCMMRSNHYSLNVCFDMAYSSCEQKVRCRQLRAITICG